MLVKYDLLVIENKKQNEFIILPKQSAYIKDYLQKIPLPTKSISNKDKTY